MLFKPRLLKAAPVNSIIRFMKQTVKAEHPLLNSAQKNIRPYDHKSRRDSTGSNMRRNPDRHSLQIPENPQESQLPDTPQSRLFKITNCANLIIEVELNL
jgi:hypothetical protein